MTPRLPKIAEAEPARTQRWYRGHVRKLRVVDLVDERMRNHEKIPAAQKALYRKLGSSYEKKLAAYKPARGGRPRKDGREDAVILLLITKDRKDLPKLKRGRRKRNEKVRKNAAKLRADKKLIARISKKSGQGARTIEKALERGRARQKQRSAEHVGR